MPASLPWRVDLRIDPWVSEVSDSALILIGLFVNPIGYAEAR